MGANRPDDRHARLPSGEVPALRHRRPPERANFGFPIRPVGRLPAATKVAIDPFSNRVWAQICADPQPRRRVPTRVERGIMSKSLAGAVAIAALTLGLAACGDTRSNRDLNGVATWPLGGPASGPWREPTYSYNYGPSPYDYGSSETTTTTTTVRPAYPPTYPPAYPPYP
jgi:hypothetical protein